MPYFYKFTFTYIATVNCIFNMDQLVIDATLQAPFSCGVFASRGSGKSVFTKNLLLSSIIYPPIKKVVWLYKTWQENLFQELQNQSLFEIEFMDDLPNFELIESKENICFVIDDMMQESSNSNQVSSLFTRGRHMNISVIYLAQNLFHRGKHSRDISLNLDYIVMFKNVRDKLQIKSFARQMFPDNSKFLIDSYTDATKKPYGYLFLDLKPNSFDQARIRGNILENQNEIIVYIPKIL